MKLELKNIVKTYKKNNKNIIALDNINLEFNSCGLYLILGRSGSGKTTLLNMISGLDNPTRGCIINEYGLNQTSFVFQDYQLIEYLTLYENLKFVCDLYKIDYKLIDEYAEKYLIKNVLDHYPNEVSGGEKQRCAIIRSFLASKPIILCDEPTGNLDEENAKIVVEALKSESKNHIIIVVSHDTQLFVDVADKVINLKNGKVIEEKNNNILDNKPSIISNKVNFNIKNIIFLLNKFFKKNIFKHTMFFITLILTFFLLFASLSSISNRYSKMLNKVCNDECIAQINFVKEGSIDPKVNQSYKDLLKEKEKHGADAIYYDYGFLTINNTLPSRTYISNRINYNILYGTNSLEYKEILISDYVALHTGLEFDNLVGLVYKECKISGIYDTGFYKIGKNLTKDEISNLEYNNDYIDKQYSSMYMNQNTFEYILKNTSEFDCEIRLSNYNLATYILNGWDEDVIYGECTKLDDDSIGISMSIAKEYAENMKIDVSNLVGQKIDVKYVLSYSRNEPHKYYTKEYVVAYIFGGSTSRDRLVLSINNYNEGVLLYNYNTANSIDGIVLYDYNSKNISKILKRGYIDDIALSDTITNGNEWLNSLKYIELGLSAIMLIITIIVLINFIHNIFESEKAVQGLLASFGIKKKSIINIYLLEIFFIMLISIMVALILQIPLIIGINGILVHYVKTLKLLYFEPISVLYVFSILVVLMIIIYLILLKNIKKKSIIDIIYQR